MDNQTPSKIDLRYAEEKVVFYICNCSLDKKYSFYGLDKGEATKLIKKLRHIEEMTWSQWASLDRKRGLTSEIPESDSFSMIDAQDSSEQKMVDIRYYFHFRIEQTGLFRVFGYQRKQFFCVTHMDPKGNIHHN